MYYFIIIIIIIQLNTGTTLLHKTLPWPSWPTPQIQPQHQIKHVPTENYQKSSTHPL